MLSHLWFRIPFGLFLIAHGVAHLVGTFGMWGLSESDPETGTAALTWLVEGAGGRINGAIWLLLAVAFSGLGIGLIAGHARPELFVGVAAASLIACLLVWPSAPAGVVINVLLVILGLTWLYFRGA